MLLNNKLLQPSFSDRQGFNRRWFANNKKLKVFRPTTATEVVAAFQQIIDSNQVNEDQVQITCGRHCYENFVYNKNTTAIIDVGSLNHFNFDENEAVLSIDVGFSNWEMYRTLNNIYKKTLPAGSCYSVGLGGHITGGGYGLLSRLYGLPIDYLCAVDIVIQNEKGEAELLHCDANNNSDLLWGVKGGGGGQFGIITRYYFEKPPSSPERMYTFSLTWDWQKENSKCLSREQFAQIIKLFEKEFCNQDEDSWHRWANMHLNHIDAKNITIAAFVYYVPEIHGDLNAFEKNEKSKLQYLIQQADAIDDLSTKDYKLYGHPYISSTQALNGNDNDPIKGKLPASLRQYTYLNGTQEVNGSGDNAFGKYKSAYLTQNWTEYMVEQAYIYLTQPVYIAGKILADMSKSLIQVDSYGGKINQVSPTATAIPQRSSIMKLQYQSYWDNPLPPGQDDHDQALAHIDWLNEMYTAIYKKTGGFPTPNFQSSGSENIVDGCYYNYPDIDLGNINQGEPSLEFALQLYFGINLKRLKNIKALYNHKGWFSNSQSIALFN